MNIDIKYHGNPPGLNSSNFDSQPSAEVVKKSVTAVAKKQVKYGNIFLMSFSFTALFENNPVTKIKAGI